MKNAMEIIKHAAMAGSVSDWQFDGAVEACESLVAAGLLAFYSETTAKYGSEEEYSFLAGRCDGWRTYKITERGRQAFCEMRLPKALRGER